MNHYGKLKTAKNVSVSYTHLDVYKRQEPASPLGDWRDPVPDKVRRAHLACAGALAAGPSLCPAVDVGLQHASAAAARPPGAATAAAQRLPAAIVADPVQRYGCLLYTSRCV